MSLRTRTLHVYANEQTLWWVRTQNLWYPIHILSLTAVRCPTIWKLSSLQILTQGNLIEIMLFIMQIIRAGVVPL